jgi:hypothetical protein
MGYEKDVPVAPMPEMGIHLYRHLGIVLQRRFLHFQVTKNDQGSALEETMHWLSGQSVGHG